MEYCNHHFKIDCDEQDDIYYTCVHCDKELSPEGLCSWYNDLVQRHTDAERQAQHWMDKALSMEKWGHAFVALLEVYVAAVSNDGDDDPLTEG